MALGLGRWAHDPVVSSAQLPFSSLAFLSPSLVNQVSLFSLGPISLNRITSHDVPTPTADPSLNKSIS